MLQGLQRRGGFDVEGADALLEVIEQAPVDAALGVGRRRLALTSAGRLLASLHGV